ncbi:MAG: GxxExxY protein [Candidatus Harrisonbacteria bacterium]|nr:GxxExxY protein [Candidatus Harrisonbacteria bacterium]
MQKQAVIYKSDLLYPELSYQLIGVLFDVYLNLGYGYREIQYQKAIEIALKSSGVKYHREYPVKLLYKGEFLTTNFLDFVIDDKVVLEVKQGDLFRKTDIDQVLNYLKATKMKLGILARFTKSGVKFKRIINLY